MRARYVVDTNVLIAASAGDPVNPAAIEATPEDPALREEVWHWLVRFQNSDTRLVLDRAGKIFDEYMKKLGFNDFGIQVVMHKWSTAAVDDVDVQYDADGHGVLPEPLAEVVHDTADRKMVAAALASYETFGEGCIAFAGDTDWHDWEDVLLACNVLLEPVIGDWSRRKHLEKKKR
ncbi:hypothetical protein [Yanghanlia caeni]|uniref:PIN domain-containing protein n=1 Tax=Yanghanlia caeni TaxID=3064283 RepID=A0ABU1D6R7_9BURK|nr:hypothetical protein [Alcaligenaceae bacterium LG-2]NGR06783.1 hypothetical protein [bacterium SGD-2]HZH56013.1 hypothetical protein [Burkholderiaceae bacterium]